MSRKHEMKKHMFLDEAERHAVLMQHTEFRCPVCGGIASAIVSEGEIKAECHACCIKGYRRVK